MKRRQHCYGCGSTAICHFQLVHATRRPDGRMTTRGAGSIDLCERCWREATTAARLYARRRPSPRLGRRFVQVEVAS